MANNKKFSMLLRIVAGTISAIIGLVVMHGIFVSGKADVDFRTFAMVFGCAWLGFVAISGTDAVSFVMSSSNDKSES